MDHQILITLHLFFVFFHVNAQTPPQREALKLKSSLGIVIAILSLTFFLTLILLLLAKFLGRSTIHSIDPGIRSSSAECSGVEKTLIDSLPFFKFSALKGSKEGLECSVCLSNFEDIEILQLLPRCKHAFHIECINHWLEKHSDCPLCRQKVSFEDLTLFTYSNSMRFLSREDSNVELLVQREEDDRGSSRKIKLANSEEQVLMRNSGEVDEEDKVLHKLNHMIIVSDFVFKNRWSNVSSSDLMFLNTEMISSISSDRFPSLDSNEHCPPSLVSVPDIPSASDPSANSRQKSRVSNAGERRSVSEITSTRRFPNISTRNILSDASMTESKADRERTRLLWYPIARRTVRWFANREKRSQKAEHIRKALEV